jgi:hypothetical protein
MRNIGISKIMFGISAACFLLALLTVTLGSLNLVTLGLLFLALGMFL